MLKNPKQNEGIESMHDDGESKTKRKGSNSSVIPEKLKKKTKDSNLGTMPEKSKKN